MGVQGWGASTVSNNPLCIPPAGKYFVPSTINLQMYVRFTRDDWQALSLHVLSLLLNWFQLTNTVGRIPMGCGEAKSSQPLKIANDLTSTSTMQTIRSIFFLFKYKLFQVLKILRPMQSANLQKCSFLETLPQSIPTFYCISECECMPRILSSYRLFH